MCNPDWTIPSFERFNLGHMVQIGFLDASFQVKWKPALSASLVSWHYGKVSQLIHNYYKRGNVILTDIHSPQRMILGLFLAQRIISRSKGKCVCWKFATDFIWPVSSFLVLCTFASQQDVQFVWDSTWSLMCFQNSSFRASILLGGVGNLICNLQQILDHMHCVSTS